MAEHWYGLPEVQFSLYYSHYHSMAPLDSFFFSYAIRRIQQCTATVSATPNSYMIASTGAVVSYIGCIPFTVLLCLRLLQET